MSKITLSAFKADIGSIGGHICPSKEVIEAVRNHIIKNKGPAGIIDFRMGNTGDDIWLLISHRHGKNNSQIHKLVFDAFMAGTEKAKEQGLYGAGQDLLSNSFSGNIKGLGPGIAEMEFEERPNEPFLLFTADKTDPGAFNLPFYLAFADPMYNSGLLLSPKISEGFEFSIIDVNYTKCPRCNKFHFIDQSCGQTNEGHPAGDRIIELDVPEDLYKIAALIRDTERFIIESVLSRYDGQQAAAISTTRLHNIAGKYTGKDDPIAIIRVQGSFPATGEILSPFSIGHYVAGFMRGSHIGPLMPVEQNSTISYFDGPPIVQAAGFSVQNGIFTGPVDLFDHQLWNQVRNEISKKALEIRRQGFFGAAMLPMNELEYGGIVEILKNLDNKFFIRQ